MGGIVGGGKGGGGGGGGIVGPSQFNTQSPGFNVNSIFQNGVLNTNVNQRNTPFQQANEASFLRLINQDLPQLREDNAFGSSLFRTAALDQLTSGERRARSNLVNQQELRSTRGSSFAADDQSRLANEFAQGRAGVEAQVAAQELAGTQQLLRFEQEANIAQASRELAEAGLGQNQANNLARLNVEAQVANAQIEQQQNAGKGALFGTLFSQGLGAFGFGGAFGQANKQARQQQGGGTFAPTSIFSGNLGSGVSPTGSDVQGTPF